MFRDSDIEVIAQILASNPSSNYNPDIDVNFIFLNM